MPYKFNKIRRHKIPRAKYRVTNWPEYDAALVRRGSLTIWVTEEAVAAWHAPATGKRGGQTIYSDIAIETGLALRLVLHQPLRQTEGALRSIVGLLGVDIKIPDHTTFSRRGGRLMILPKRIERGEPLRVLVDSTGVKIYGEGEWHDQKHGVPRCFQSAPIFPEKPASGGIQIGLCKPSSPARLQQTQDFIGCLLRPMKMLEDVAQSDLSKKNRG